MQIYTKDRALADNFRLSEVKCHCGKCPGLPDDLTFVEIQATALQILRGKFGNPVFDYECWMKITSWCRCIDHNASPSVQGSEDSLHLPKNHAAGCDVVVYRPCGRKVPSREVAIAAHGTGLFSGIIAYPKWDMTHLDQRGKLGKLPYFRNFGPFPPVRGSIAVWAA